MRDVEASTPVDLDTIWRIYSMTKPITAVAALTLWEQGGFELKDPVAKYLPAFAETKVWRAGSSQRPVLDPQVEPMQLWQLFSHTAGLTYGFMYAHPVDALYRQAGFEWGAPDTDLEGICDTLAGLPLLFQPGSEWQYSMGLDVLGRVVEVISGQRFDEYLQEHVLDAARHDRDRLVGARWPTSAGSPRCTPRTRPPGWRCAWTRWARPRCVEPKAHLGGGGLVSTAHDYHRFVEMLRRGGELDGVRVLAPGTVRYMASNHLPGGVDLTDVRPAAVRRDGLRRRRLRSRRERDDRPGEGQGARPGRRVRLGRRGEHGVLGGPGGGPDGDVLHPAAAEQHPPDPHPAEVARLPVDRRLTRARSGGLWPIGRG